MFVVGCLGDWRSAAEVLFESDCLRRDTTKGRKARERVAYPVADSAGALQARDYKGINSDDAHAGGKLIVYETHPADSRINEMGKTCQTVTSRWGTGGGNVPLVQAFDSYNLNLSDTNQTIKSPQGGTLESVGGVIAFEPGIAKREGGDSRFVEEMSPTLRKEMGDNQVAVAYSVREDAKANTFSATELEVSNAISALRPSPQSHHAQVFVAHTFKIRGGGGDGGKGYLGSDEKTFTISTTQDQQLFANMAVRRLTPMECERLQGFPDGYTDIKPKNKATPDGPRYKALGNSMAVPCMAWIGEGIDMIENP
jgi:DNA (cytosine-5)-methyltransferase 1